MYKLKTFYHSHTKSLLAATGLLFSCILMLPYFLLGTGSIVPYHDQLDSEVLHYILTAKYLFTDADVYPEILHGIPATGAIPPVPLLVLFYVFLEPFSAFMLSQWIVYIVGFLGMYLLVYKLTSRYFVSFGIAVVFMLFPFYPVYGLCIPGQPLLIYSVLCLYRQEGKKWLYLALIFLYSLGSSLVLAGFACLLTLGAAALVMTIRSLSRKAPVPFPLWLSLTILILGYLVCNLDLIRQILFPAPEEISHKTEVVYSARGFFDSFWEALRSGTLAAEVWPAILLPTTALCLLFLLHSLLRHNLAAVDYICRALKKAAAIFGFILLLCLFCAFYSSSYITDLRNSAGHALASFNLTRSLWLLPTAWCILAGYLLSSLYPAGATHKFGLFVRYSIILVVLLLWSFTNFSHSSLKYNVSKLLKGRENYYAMDWDSFYACDIFRQIDAVIGKPKESYRVVSLGIDPAAAAYNGFYCLDGYSNNYPLSYKHAFREIMADELAKNEYSRLYFDNWGNRCYLFTAEYTTYFTLEKKWSNGFHDLALNIEKLKELDCSYIFAATWIENADELGLTLLAEPFETEKSWYRIYVYAIK